ncbi:ParB/RepB/Spo0J family partition protein [Streptomyces sp. NBC_01244]|uniref:ParB/RepB/Spo0J family partition protein n=1 Tax=Streptomyces sp. NBC_01244 TaxID=2903797 RepID=UPI002E1113DD|nr:ParB/RepB/Spo0J family partition protein [Streptomyces sp. NBC_01244]
MTAIAEEITSTEATASPNDAENMALIWLDPRAIQAGRNIRPVDLDPAFVGSIRERGVLEPVTVVSDDLLGYSLVFGFHRHAAAVEAGLDRIPAIVRSDISTNAAKIIEQLTENIHRSDMRPSDIAAAYDQLALEGLDVDEISRQVSQDKTKVAASLRLHKMPQAARDAADAGQLDLEQSMGLAEFENDSKVYARLMKAVASGGNLKYALATERRRKKNRESKAKAKATLLLAGVNVVPQPSWESKAVRLRSIRNGEETHTAETHAQCPGHAAHLSEEGAITYVCREPKKYGHEVLGYYKHLSEEEQSARDAADQAEEERKEARSIAGQVRRDYVAELARVNKVPKGLYKAVVTNLFAFGLTENTDRARLGDAFSLLGANPAKDVPLAESMRRRVDRTPEHKLPLVMFAQLAVLAETNMQHSAYRYRFNIDFAIAWLELLSTYGYTLTEPEEEMLAEMRKQREERDAPEPQDEEEQDEQDEEDDVQQDDEAPSAEVIEAAAAPDGEPTEAPEPEVAPDDESDEDEDPAEEPENGDHAAAGAGMSLAA